MNASSIGERVIFPDEDQPNGNLNVQNGNGDGHANGEENAVENIVTDQDEQANADGNEPATQKPIDGANSMANYDVHEVRGEEPEAQSPAGTVNAADDSVAQRDQQLNVGGQIVEIHQAETNVSQVDEAETGKFYFQINSFLAFKVFQQCRTYNNSYALRIRRRLKIISRVVYAVSLIRQALFIAN